MPPPGWTPGASGPGGRWNNPSTGAPRTTWDDPAAPSAPAPAAPSGGGGGSPSYTAPPLSVPAPAGLLTNPATGRPYDFNDQTQRDAYRTNTGGYIDNTGVYAPGAGARVGDTWSGANANLNEAPSPTRLPIINGHPVSPSNGFTGDQTPYIMYRGDPNYSRFFGPDTPGYTSTSRTYNATPGPLPQGQATLPMPAAPAPATTNAPATTPSVPAPAALGSQPAANDPSWLAGITGQNPSGTGYGPYATPEPPQLTSQGTYNDGGRVIEKSVDQYGHEYFHQVGTAPGAPNTPATPTTLGANTPSTPGTTTPGTNTPASNPPPGSAPRVLIGLDGKPISADLTDAEYQQALKDLNDARQAQHDAIAFTQGLDKQKFDAQLAMDAWTRTYQQALIVNQNAQLAQQAANQAMQVELARQAQELQRQQQAQTVSLEREKLDLQRQQIRGNRRGAHVRYA